MDLTDGVTVLELVADLAGMIDGPTDLSTNEVYLQDLGEDAE